MRYIDERFFDYDFICTPKLNISYDTLSANNIKVTVQVVKLADKDTVQCNAWKNDFLIYSVKLPYIKNHTYKLSYRFSKEEGEPIMISTRTTGEWFNTSSKVEKEYGSLKIKKEMDPVQARKLYRNLRKYKYIGKVFWDHIDGYWDVCCYACRHPDSKISESLSCPSTGRVYKTDHPSHTPRYLKNDISSDHFWYEYQSYNKIPASKQSLVTYYNKQEYEKVIKKYEPTDAVYLNNTQYNDWVAGLSAGQVWQRLGAWPKVEYPKFEDLWKECCSILQVDYLYFDKKFNRYASIIDEGRAEEDYEKVISLEWLRYNNTYPPFDKFWDEINLTQSEIDSNGNVRGGAYRLLKTYLKDSPYKLWDEGVWAKDKKVDEKDWNELIKLGVAEKVVTFGWHQSHPKDSVECPVCRALYDTAQVCNWIGWRKILDPFIFSNLGSKWVAYRRKKRLLKDARTRNNE